MLQFRQFAQRVGPETWGLHLIFIIREVWDYVPYSELHSKLEYRNDIADKKLPV